jgi:hypothetical protein
VEGSKLPDTFNRWAMILLNPFDFSAPCGRSQ